MRLGQSRRARLVSTLLVLALSLLGFLPQLAHAATYVGFGASNLDGVTCGSNCNANALTTEGIGEIVQAPFSGTLTAAGFFTGSQVPNQIVILTGGSTLASTTYSGGSCGSNQCAFANDGQGPFTVRDVESLSGLSASTFFTVNLAAPVSVTINQFVAIEFMRTSGAGTAILMQVGTGSSPAILDACFGFATTNPTIGSTFNTGSSSCTRNTEDIVGGSFTATGQTGTTVTVTQCYGNCGSPAITLANTNSTHSVNFNQSITLFYAFQSKQYSNGQGIVEAIYTVPSCPLGQSPFTQQCPGYLASGWNVIGNPNKGKLSNGNYQIPISNGQWAAVSISGVFAPLDLNDTNTPLNVFQTQGGGCACPPPATITQAAVYNSAFKMGLWAWIVGNIVTSQPPTSPGVNACPGLDCILTEATNSFCTNVTTACQTGSALFWVIILTIISIVTVVMAFSNILPEANIGRMGIGELAILFFLGWIVIFTSFNLLSIYVLLLVFFVVAALSAKTVRGYVGI